MSIVYVVRVGSCTFTRRNASTQWTYSSLHSFSEAIAHRSSDFKCFSMRCGGGTAIITLHWDVLKSHRGTIHRTSESLLNVHRKTNRLIQAETRRLSPRCMNSKAFSFHVARNDKATAQTAIQPSPSCTGKSPLTFPPRLVSPF